MPAPLPLNSHLHTTEPLLTFRQAAALLGIPYWKIQRAAQIGLVPTTTFLNSRRYVRFSEIELILGRSPAQRGGAS
jgi:hypothetical protein